MMKTREFIFHRRLSKNKLHRYSTVFDIDGGILLKYSTDDYTFILHETSRFIKELDYSIYPVMEGKIHIFRFHFVQ